MTPLRICLVSHLYPIDPGDYKGVFVHEIAVLLAERGHEVHVVTPRRPGAVAREQRDGVHIHRFRHWGWWRGRQLGQLKGYPPLMLGTLMLVGVLVTLGIVVRRRIALLHAYWVVPGGLIAVLAGLLTRRRVVATAAGSDLNIAARKGPIRPFVKFTLRRLDRVMAAGTQMREIALALGVPENRCDLILPPTQGTAASGVAAPPDLCGQPGARILYLGNLTPPKRVDTLLRAFARVREAHPGAGLTILGAGELRKPLEALAGELNLGDSVLFHGRLPHDQVPDALAAADLFVHCSDHEGLPVAITEAMIAGLPTICARVGGIPDIVAEGRTGFLLEPDDVGGFAERMVRLLGDEALRLEMSRNAHDYAAKHFDNKAIIGQILAVYRAALDR